MESYITKFAFCAFLIASSALPAAAQCSNTASPDYSSAASCIANIDIQAIPECNQAAATATTSYDFYACECAKDKSAYSCATSICGITALLASAYDPSVACITGAAASSDPYGIYTTSSGVSAQSTVGSMTGSTASVSSLVGSTASLSASISSPTGAVASSSSSAEASIIRGSMEVVVPLLIWIAGGLF